MYATLSAMPVISPIARLERLVRDLGSQRAAAQSLGIGASYFNDLLRGRRDCSLEVLRKLGLRRVVVSQ